MRARRVLTSWGSSGRWPQTWWLTTTEAFSLTTRKAESPKSRCQQGPPPARSSRGGSVPCVFSFRWLRVSPGWWLHRSNLCLRFHMAFSSSVCVSLIRTLVIEFRVHPDNDPHRSLLLKIPNYVHKRSSPPPPPNKVIFAGPKNCNVDISFFLGGGPPFNPLQDETFTDLRWGGRAVGSQWLSSFFLTRR